MAEKKSVKKILQRPKGSEKRPGAHLANRENKGQIRKNPCRRGGE